jgi:hypothetical protein
MNGTMLTKAPPERQHAADDDDNHDIRHPPTTMMMHHYRCSSMPNGTRITATNGDLLSVPLLESHGRAYLLFRECLDIIKGISLGIGVTGSTMTSLTM